MDEHEVIAALVSHLRENGYPNLEVDQWPDTDNRTSPDIDAIAGQFAIEHTSIDSLSNQRRNDDWFMEVVGDFREEFKGKLNFCLDVRVGYHSVTKGQSWPEIKEAVREWICNSSPSLLDGTHEIDNIPGVPFPLYVYKSFDRAPGVFFGRSIPEDDSLADRLKRLIDKKSIKLVRYKNDGKTTLLLIQAQDILRNVGRFLTKTKEAYPDGLPATIDQFWYVEVDEQSDQEQKLDFKELTAFIGKRSK